MKEVLEYEAIIRTAMPQARDDGQTELVADALAIMQGRPTSHVIPGATRKQRLCHIAGRLKQYLPLSPVTTGNALTSAQEAFCTADPRAIEEIIREQRANFVTAVQTGTQNQSDIPPDRQAAFLAHMDAQIAQQKASSAPDPGDDIQQPLVMAVMKAEMEFGAAAVLNDEMNNDDMFDGDA